MDFDMFELLSADHRRLGHLVAGEAPELNVIKELSMHLGAEVRLLYPAMEHHLDGGDETAEQLRRDDHELQELLARLESDGAGAVSVDQLRAMVQRHVDSQERLFPTLKAAIGPDEAARLGQEVSRAVREAPTHPHPHLPDHGILEPAADAIASTIDHLRDAGRHDDH